MREKDRQRPVKDFARPITTTINVKESIGGALRALRQKQVDEKIIYFYVVDDDKKLKGVISTRDLLLADNETLVTDVMEPAVIFVKAEETLGDALQYFAKHGLLALPVVDKDKKLLGAIDVDLYLEEAIDVRSSQRRQDVFQYIGLSLEDLKLSVWKGYSTRMPWIFCNMFGGVMCAIISHYYEVVLSKVLLLAMFIPLVLSLSESVSMQSMTQSLQSIKKAKISFLNFLVRSFKEIKVAVLIAFSSGLTVGLISFFFKEGLIPSIVISLGIALSTSISASGGLLVPMLLHISKLDPKVASGPIVLALADVLTTLLYLTLASIMIL